MRSKVNGKLTRLNKGFSAFRASMKSLSGVYPVVDVASHFVRSRDRSVNQYDFSNRNFYHSSKNIIVFKVLILTIDTCTSTLWVKVGLHTNS